MIILYHPNVLLQTYAKDSNRNQLIDNIYIRLVRFDEKFKNLTVKISKRKIMKELTILKVRKLSRNLEASFLLAATFLLTVAVKPNSLNIKTTLQNVKASKNCPK